ncbi:MAG: hypothetical protein PVF95_06910 [bacterium]|jgi:hypothetical protein
MKTRPILAALAVMSLAILVSCGDDNGANVNGGPEYSRATPEDLIRALAAALEEEEIDVYAECLHDEYLFEFLPGDAGSAGLPPDGPWWGKTEDVASTSNMFAAAFVTRIECELPVDTGPWATDEGLGFRLDAIIKVTSEGGGYTEPRVYMVQDSYLYAEVVTDPYDGGKWVFKALLEAKKEGLTAGPGPDPGRLTEPTTFGSIKALFRPEGL